MFVAAKRLHEPKNILTGAATIAAGQPRTRNVVFILTDDHRFDFISAMGHPWLAATAKFPTFPALLKQNGYRTGFIGEWHMGGEDEPQPGFDHWLSFRGQGEYNNPQVNRNGERVRLNGYMADILTEEAVAFLLASKDGPFCLYLSHKNVHDPFEPAPRHRGRFRDSRDPVSGDLSIDESIGRLREELERLGVAKTRCWSTWEKRDTCTRAQAHRRARDARAVHSRTADNVVPGSVRKGTVVTQLLPTWISRRRSWHGQACRFPPTSRAARSCPSYAAKHRSGAMSSHTSTTGNAKHRRHLQSWVSALSSTATCNTTVCGDRFELYDIVKDPDQRRNLLGNVVSGMRYGRFERFIAGPAVKRLHDDLQARLIAEIKRLGGHFDPEWGLG